MLGGADFQVGNPLGQRRDLFLQRFDHCVGVSASGRNARRRITGMT
jgi:hypothetical protein